MRNGLGRALLGMVVLAGMGEALSAQMPGAPVLQNAFSNPGITVAANVANLGGATSYAAAGAWAPGGGRFQLSAGVGAQTRADTPTRTVYGARVNVPVFGMASSFGVSVFAGFGGLSGRDLDSTVAKSIIPAGLTASYRLSMGSIRGVSVYASPLVEWVTRGGTGGNATVFRGALGADFALTSSIGLTLGVELGAKHEASTGKPSGTAFGAGLSYALGR